MLGVNSKIHNTPIQNIVILLDNDPNPVLIPKFIDNDQTWEKYSDEMSKVFGELGIEISERVIDNRVYRCFQTQDKLIRLTWEIRDVINSFRAHEGGKLDFAIQYPAIQKNWEEATRRFKEQNYSIQMRGKILSVTQKSQEILELEKKNP